MEEKIGTCVLEGKVWWGGSLVLGHTLRALLSLVPVQWAAAEDSGIIPIPSWVASLSGLVILGAAPKVE